MLSLAVPKTFTFAAKFIKYFSEGYSLFISQFPKNSRPFFKNLVIFGFSS